MAIYQRYAFTLLISSRLTGEKTEKKGKKTIGIVCRSVPVGPSVDSKVHALARKMYTNNNNNSFILVKTKRMLVLLLCVCAESVLLGAMAIKSSSGIKYHWLRTMKTEWKNVDVDVDWCRESIGGTIWTLHKHTDESFRRHNYSDKLLLLLSQLATS